MGKSSSAPAAPDPQETAAAEAQYNRLDTYSPSGSGTRYGHTDENGNFVAGQPAEGQQSAVSYQENEYEQQIREMLEPASVALTDRVVQDNIYDMPDAARVQDRSDVAQDLFDRTFSLMSPGIDKSNERLLTNLQSRGIPVGSEAFNEAYGEQLQQTQDTVSRLAMDANINAGAEQTRQYGLDQAERSSAISELVAAMGGGYSAPNAVPSGSASNVNYSSLVGQQYQSELAQYQADQQSNSATAGALGSIGAALIKSDRRLKTDIVAVGKTGTLTVYEYRYLWEPVGTVHRGYMAQEVLLVVPQAVHLVKNFLALDYAMLPKINNEGRV